MQLRFPVIALFTAITLAACSTDAPLAPMKTPKSPSLSMGVGQRSGGYVVRMTGPQTADALSAQVAALGGRVDSYHVDAGIAIVSGLSDAGAADLASSVAGDVQPDFAVAPDDPNMTIHADASDVGSPTIQSQLNPAGASRFPFQWNMRLINAPAAWTAGKLGSADVTVAILDTGIDYDAPDLVGLVDLSRSKSFMNHFIGQLDDPTTPADEYDPIVPSDDEILTAFFPGRHLITDLNGHGTNVATQVSSKAAALAGVTSKTTLIGVKVLGANGVGDFGDILNGVLWAADHGADVANMSLGGGFSKQGNGQAIAAINQVFNYAKQKGMAIVVSAGNSGIDLKHNGNQYSTFCDAPHVICVSSVGPRLATSDPNEPAFYTNFGKNNVDVAAPGGNADAAHGNTPSRWPWSAPAPAPFTANDVASWVWSFCAKQTLIIQKAADGVHGNLFLTSCVAGNRLTGFIGTSQASPHVAGLAALLVAETGKGNPDKLKKMIQKSGAPMDKTFGRNRIDVAKAVGL
jgi:subtilisin family serine protease